MATDFLGWLPFVLDCQYNCFCGCVGSVEGQKEGSVISRFEQRLTSKSI